MQLKHLDKTSDRLYENKSVASAMLLHDIDALSVVTCSFVVETKNSLFKELSGIGLLLHLGTVCAKHLFYTPNV